MPKNIILLADGTGNSAASPFKTNVWRLYQAVDVRPAPASGLPQVVRYHDGVGTGSFRPLVVLGLALGIGVARAVKDLYAFLCRNYEPGDNIFLFGFSRGAFTVRILAGVILRCGLVTAQSEAELMERVKTAYAEYKRDVARRATATRPRLLAGRILGRSQPGHGTDHVEFNFTQWFPRIRFIGVWDTVDAYGMPIDELKTGIDRYVWPMTLADRQFSDHIEHACHALSLDDERPTFRPVLWSDPSKDPKRLQQVWFAGVHADVGGGYPDDSLANVTLAWMIDEAVRCGLRVHQADVDEFRRRANPHGAQHDSRAGVAGYYRYGPRSVDRLSNDRQHGVNVAEPTIHRAVMDRIREREVGYAPISFPELSYGVHPAGPAESPPDIVMRSGDMESVRDAVLRRQAAYLGTVALTCVLGILPIVDWLTGGVPVGGGRAMAIPGWPTVAQGVSRLLSKVATLGVVPGWAAPWVSAFARHPTVFLIAAGLLAWLFVRKSSQIQDQIFARAEYSWRRV